VLASANSEALRDVLELADLVKFAKENPLPDRHDYCLNQGIEFVSKTGQSGSGSEPKTTKES
jgi:hypothetical protein